MEAKVVRWGDDLAVRFSAEEVERLGMREGQVVEVLPAAASAVEADAPSRPHSANGIPIYTLEEMVAEARRLGPKFEPPTVDWGPDRGSEIIDDDDPR